MLVSNLGIVRWVLGRCLEGENRCEMSIPGVFTSYVLLGKKVTRGRELPWHRQAQEEVQRVAQHVVAVVALRVARVLLLGLGRVELWGLPCCCHLPEARYVMCGAVGLVAPWGPRVFDTKHPMPLLGNLIFWLPFTTSAVLG